MRLSIVNLCIITGSLLALSSCQKEYDAQLNAEESLLSAAAKANQESKFNTYKGPQLAVGNGHARTFATISHTGVPREVGIVLTDGALSGLPEMNTTYSLQFHHKATEATLFQHVAMGLSAHGHGLPPSGSIASHFDGRFFMMTEAERLAIPVPPAPGFNMAPPAGYLPANYSLNAAVAQIGRHWGEHIFTPGVTVNHTMIYGTWNGALTFINPIVTLATLAGGASYSVLYPQPLFFAEHGFYPTKYNVYADNKRQHYISLSDFVWR